MSETKSHGSMTPTGKCKFPDLKVMWHCVLLFDSSYTFNRFRLLTTGQNKCTCYCIKEHPHAFALLKPCLKKCTQAKIVSSLTSKPLPCDKWHLTKTCSKPPRYFSNKQTNRLLNFSHTPFKGNNALYNRETGRELVCLQDESYCQYQNKNE